MNDLLDQLLGYSYQLYKLNMRQPAGDYDYLVAWLRSTDPINSDKHFGVVPAGENTISPFANNCPIPYTATKELVKDNYNEVMCLCLVENIYQVLTELLSNVSSDDEITAVNAYLNYTSKLITLLNGEDPGPAPAPHGSAYLDDPIAPHSGWVHEVYSDEDHENVIVYDVTKLYTLTKWYDSSGEEHINNGELLMDRYFKSTPPGTVGIKNTTDSDIDVVSFDYETSNSNRLQACFSQNTADSSSAIKQKVTIQPGEYAIACAPTYNEDDDDTAQVIIYEEYTSYSGVRYRAGSSGAFKEFDGDLSLGKEYIPSLDVYALVIKNNSDSSIEIRDFEYIKAAAHVLSIVAPDVISGDSCSIKAMYNGNIINPLWEITPAGPTITGSTLSFTESGTYSLSASYNDLTVTKQIELDFKSGWSTETVIDDSGDYPVANTTITDDEGNKESEIVTYIDGEPVNTGFEIEPASEDTPIEINEGKNTKIYTFDGTNGFELFFKFHYDPSLQPAPDYADKPGETDTSKHFTMLNMKYEVAPYPGIVIRNNEGTNNIQISITPINPTDPSNPTKYIYFNFTEDGIYDIYMRYEPSAPFEKFVIVDRLTGEVKSKFEQYTYEFRNEVTATLGYVNAGTSEDPIPCRQCIFDVYDFRLNKIMTPWKDIPTVTEISSVGDLLITKEITNDEAHLVRKMTVEPGPGASDEYVLLEDGLIFNDIIPFIDNEQSFELEFDVMVDYEDQKPYNGQYQVLVNMIPEVNPYQGFCVRLSNQGRPGTADPSEYPLGYVEYRLKYSNDNTTSNVKASNATYKIDDDYIVHYRYIYEGAAVRKCSALYSYKSNAYRIFTKDSELYHVPAHSYPLCIGCALDANMQKFRVCKMRIKKIEYIRNIR